MAETKGPGKPESDDHHGPMRESVDGASGTIRPFSTSGRAYGTIRTRDPEETACSRILTAGTHSATGGNLQPYSIILIRNEERRRHRRMVRAIVHGESPVHLLFCLDLHRLERRAALEGAPFSARSSLDHFWIGFQDTIVCAQSICTAADALGIGSVYIGTILDFTKKTRERLRSLKVSSPSCSSASATPACKPKPRKKLEAEVVGP